MHVYFACTPAKQHTQLLCHENVKNILMSFHFIKDPKRLWSFFDGYEPKKLMIDSGAFSVWSNGGTVDIDQYADFCLEVKRLAPSSTEINVVNLDVLPGVWGFVPTQQEIDNSAEKGWQNMLYLEKKIGKVIHVFHQHESFDVLDRIVERLDYIGISPANDVSMKMKLAWMNKVYAKIRNNVKTHGFAVTSHKQLYNYPYYSADSSSWTTPARYGRIPIFTDTYKMESFSYKNVNEVEKFWPYLKSIGIDEIGDTESWEGRTRISVRSYMKLEEIVTKVWKERGIEWCG